jgi:uncharacterized membrane protein YfcA
VPPGIVSAVAGGALSDRMSPGLSNLLFAILLMVVALRMLWDLQRDRRAPVPELDPEEEAAAGETA